MLYNRTTLPRAATSLACEDNPEWRRSVAIRHHAQVSHPNRPTPVRAGARIASIAKIGALVLALSATVLVCGAPVGKDPSDALVVGTHRLSAYRVDKNYRRALNLQGDLSQGGPATETKRAWFTRFLAEQVLMAQALNEGYGERPEVTGEVRRMERPRLLRLKQPFRFGETLASAMSATLGATDYRRFMEAQYLRDQSARWTPAFPFFAFREGKQVTQNNKQV